MPARHVVLLAAAALFGCATAPPTSYVPATVQRASSPDAERIRGTLSERRQRLSAETTQAEIDALKEEIAELEQRLAALEAQELQPTSNNATPGSAVHVGPRGGVYTISPSGRKVYQKRR